ncbi:integrin-binding adhesin P66 family protein [Borrelia persica]|uniref:integrin-binding adhesin P66 family protein n=1 Tax=Borrelia persica TaxID=44448 RepID=UPI000463C873|nr:integrin-binding adhesin P66 family protein [Borrelia persica]
MKRTITKVLIMLLSNIMIFAADNDTNDTGNATINNNNNTNSGIPIKLTFANSSQFRFDMDELVPGLENKLDLSINITPFITTKEVGKNDPLSGYVKIEDLTLKAKGRNDAPIQFHVENIIAQINMYDFYLKLESMTDFNFNQESLFSFAPMSKISSKYYGFPSNDDATRRTILARSTAKKIGTLQFGYNLPSQLEVILSIGATGTGNRNNTKNNDDSDEDKKKKDEAPYNNTYKGMLYGTQVTWTPIKNELTQYNSNVIVETPLEINFGISGAIGNSTFNNSSITYGLKDESIINSDLVSPTLSNASIITSIGLLYKIGLTKINDKNAYLVLKAGSDFGIDPFASDFSILGHISKKANTNNNQFDPTTNALNFNKQQSTNFAFSMGAGIGLAWNTDDGEKESWSISGKKSYNKRIFGSQDKKSGIGLGITYGKNLYKPKSTNTLLQDIATKSFQTFNAELSTYEDGKKGIIPGLGWIASIGIYDLLREKPKSDNIIAVFKQSTATTTNTNAATTNSNTPFIGATQLGAALYIDYAIPLESISSKTYITPYMGTHILQSLYEPNHNLYLKAGIEFENLIKLTKITIGWDSNNILSSQDQKGSVFITVKIAI